MPPGTSEDTALQSGGTGGGDVSRRGVQARPPPRSATTPPGSPRRASRLSVSTGRGGAQGPTRPVVTGTGAARVGAFPGRRRDSPASPARRSSSPAGGFAGSSSPAPASGSSCLPPSADREPVPPAGGGQRPFPGGPRAGGRGGGGRRQRGWRLEWRGATSPPQGELGAAVVNATLACDLIHPAPGSGQLQGSSRSPHGEPPARPRPAWEMSKVV